MSNDHSGHNHSNLAINRTFALAIILNVTFVAVEAFYGWRVNSLALLADAGHNLSDVAGLVLAWAGVLAGKLRPNPRHTYGWQRASILAAFTNALVLLVAMGALGWEAYGRLQSTPTTSGETIMVVAGVGIVLNGLTALLFLKGRTDDLNIRGAFLHMIADAAVSAGVVITGGLYWRFGWASLDPIASILIALIIIAGSFSLFRQSLHMLFDGVPAHIDPLAVRTYLGSLVGVEKVHDLHIWALSTSETALTVHLVMPQGHPGDDFLGKTESTLHDRFKISHSTIQIEITARTHENSNSHE
jgi:cobalt-zinc-cadmium efflux system protein